MEDLIAYCGANGTLFQELNSYLTEEWNTQTLIRFPYGNSYGWGVKHSIKSKHICDIFAEDQAFELMLRMDNRQYEAVYDDLLPYTKEVIDGSIHAVTADGFITAFYAVNIWRMRRSFWIRNAKAGKINLPLSAFPYSYSSYKGYCPRHPRRFPGIFHEAGLSASLCNSFFQNHLKEASPPAPAMNRIYHIFTCHKNLFNTGIG